MHCKEHSPFWSTDSAPSLIGSGNGSASNSMQPNQNMVSPPLFHDQDMACPPFPQRKELVAQVARIYWPHLINATMVQPGSLFLSLHFITAFVIMQAPRHQFLEARAISQSSIWLCDLSYGFWTLSLVLSLSIGSTGAWVWVYILYTGAWVWVYPFGLFSGHWATLLTEADPESVSLLFVCPTICLCSRRENN